MTSFPFPSVFALRPTIVLFVLFFLVPGSLSAAARESEGIPLDGKTAYRIDAATLKLPAQSFSVACRVKAEASGKPQVFLSIGRSNAGFTLYDFPERKHTRMLVEKADTGYGFATGAPLEPGRWTHFAGTYGDGFIRLYIDGREVGSTKQSGGRVAFREPLMIGNAVDEDRFLHGAIDDIRLWNRVLSPGEIAAVKEGRNEEASQQGLIARWDASSVRPEGLVSLAAGGVTAEKYGAEPVIRNEKYSGFRSIWYFNQPSNDEYVYKYSGGLGTYCAKHIPLAWHAREVDKTFFVYGGTDAKNSTLLHMVSYYDHRTGKVARPTLLLDKRTTDAHDNPVLNIDDAGHLWVFSSSHGTGRPSYISRSVKPYDIDAFECVWTGNFSYPEPFYFPGKGFLFMHTVYVKGHRTNCFMRSKDGISWTAPQTLAHFEQGHYQIADPCLQPGHEKMGVAFNMHPKGKGLNWRTNIYYMESADWGETWTTADGDKLELPLSEKNNPALVLDYQSKGRNVYIKDVQYDSHGGPVILYVLSKGYEAGPENGPRQWRVLHRNGSEWVDRATGIESGNNYDTGSIYVESDTTWRIIGPTELGPQPYNPGGEIAMWLSEDAGKTWKKTRQITRNSEYNQTYVRRPVHAHPDFYGFWADGHGRKPSEARLYFCNKSGDAFRLPVEMHEDFQRPEKIEAKPAIPPQ